MCGRFAGLSYDEVAQVVADVVRGITPNVMPDWPARRVDVHPGNEAWTIVPVPDGQAGDQLACHLEPRLLTWGFRVEWSTRSVFNTRIETALGRNPGMWEEAIKNGRCIVPSLRFYEPHGTETVPSPVTGRPMKRQYTFEMPQGHVLLMAGIMQDGRFSIATTEPNASVAPVHDRMPLVLRPEEVGAWISADYDGLPDRSHVLLESAPEPLPEGPQLSLF